MLESIKTYFRLLAEDRVCGKRAAVAAPLLCAASAFYGAGVGAVRAAYARKIFPRKRFPFPVISVGNLTWGGAGKTPLVEYLARRISETHRTPLVLSRGYSRDEIEQMRHHLPQVVVGAGKDRVKVAEDILQNRKIDVAILDDGMQHWPIERDLEIVVVNALNPFGNGQLIPRGTLRESVAQLKRADLIVLSHGNLVDQNGLESLREKIRKLAPHAGLVESFLDPLFFYRADRRKRVSLQSLQHERVTTFSAVGTPTSFQLLLARHQIRPVRNFEFTDHHVYSEEELREIKRVSVSADIEDIITTEKDFYRCSEPITKILNPLILATRLRMAYGEDILNDKLMRLLGVRR